jgi:hypothetical protein
MKCPDCGQHTPDGWWNYLAATTGGTMGSLVVAGRPIPGNDRNLPTTDVSLDYMFCANDDCGQLIIRVHETWNVPRHAVDNPEMLTRTWYARPRSASRPIDPLVPEPFRSDYLEAAAILDVSPRMSAVLARRIVGDLLKSYAGKKHWSLTARIRSFIGESGHPSGLTSNLDHLREIADFGAHTQEAEQESETGELEVVIIDADRDDAEWTLDLLDRMFDYLILQPAKDEEMKLKWDKNIERTGRAAIEPRPKEDE